VLPTCIVIVYLSRVQPINGYLLYCRPSRNVRAVGAPARSGCPIGHKNNSADSLNLIVQLERGPGRRFVSELLEVTGYDPDTDRYEFDSLYACKEEPWLPSLHPVRHGGTLG
jgi:hypothetical protein